MSGTSTMDLINTGIVMGIIHVLTGPDHLSSLATLSGTTISTTRENCNSFLLGVRWGVGHSIGLLVVGGILIAIEEESSEWIVMDEKMTVMVESCVGIFMLVLGFYGMNKACRNRQEGVRPLSNSLTNMQVKEGEVPVIEMKMPMPGDHRRASMEIINQMSEALNRDGDSLRRGGGDDLCRSLHEDEEVEARIYNAVESFRRNSETTSMADDHDMHHIDDDEESAHFLQSLKCSAQEALSDSFVKILNSKPPPMKATSMVKKHARANSIVPPSPSLTPPHRCSGCGGCCNRCCGHIFTPSMLSLIAGIVHGVAGPGGVLGVIPAVQLKDAKLATIYLSTFCITSTLVMGGFAAFYGTFSEWLAGGRRRRGGGRSYSGSRVFLVEVGSAFLSIAVGVIWLVLLSVGKLAQVFP